MWIAFCLVFSALAFLGLALWYRQLLRGRMVRRLRIDTPDGLAREQFVRIGGIDQWVQIRGEDLGNPVLLVLHGGPGASYAVFTPAIRSWEKHFTVVHWDRRGVGKTRGRSGEATPAPTFDLLVDDTIEVIEFLRGELRVEKVTVLAGSMGTMIGVPLAKKRPDLLEALVLTDLYVEMRRNEAWGQEKTLERVRAAGNRKAIAALERLGGDPTRWDLSAWQTKMQWTMKTDPVTPNAVLKLLLPLALTSPTYRLRDVLDWLAGFTALQKQMFDEYIRFDANRFGPRFEVPVAILQGATDVLTLTELAVEYFETIQAPAKHLALIDDASHFAAFTQPEALLEELVQFTRQHRAMERTRALERAKP